MTRYDESSARGSNGGLHPLAGIPQEALDAAVASYRSSTGTKGLDDDEIESIAHAVLAAALEKIPNWDASLHVSPDRLPQNVSDLNRKMERSLDPIVQRAVLRGPMWMYVLEHPRLDPRLMQDVVHHGTYRQWKHLAANPSLPEELQAKIFDSADHDLNLGHASNPNLAKRFREHLKSEGHWEVLHLLAANTKDEAAQLELINQDEGESLVDNPHATERVLQELLEKQPRTAGMLGGREDLSPAMQLALADFYDAHEPLSKRETLTMEAALVIAHLSGFVDNMVGGPLRPIEKWPVPLLRKDAPDKLEEAVLYHSESETLKGLVGNWEGTFGELVEAAEITQR